MRHTLSTLAYRANRAIEGAPPEFSAYAIGEKPRTPTSILAHMGDLLDWALSMADGTKTWKATPPSDWETEIVRFFSALERFDAFLASDAPVACPLEKLFQRPIADAISHVGQLAMLRRLAGCPMNGENYFKSIVEVGRAGAEQAPAKAPFR